MTRPSYVDGRRLSLKEQNGAQSGAYIRQAARELRAAGDPKVLWDNISHVYEGSLILGRVERVVQASTQRLWHLRTAVLYAALSAEAYANEFLAHVLTPGEIQEVDRMPVIEKLSKGPSWADLTSPLSRGTAPLQAVQQLIDLRDALAHPRPGQIPAHAASVTAEDEKRLGPPAVGRYIVAVAQVMELLDDLRPPPVFYRSGRLLAQHPEVLQQHLHQVGETILRVPQESADRPIDLFELASLQAKRVAEAAKRAL